jgi:F-type H+-transporting ATPase subunit epsilon
MSENLELRILTPLGLVVETKASEVVLPGVEGEFGVLPSHTAYLARVKSGRIAYMIEGRRESLAVRDGLAEVNGDHVVILTEKVYLPGDLKVKELEAMEKEAQAALGEVMDGGGDIDRWVDELAFIQILRTMAGQP